MWCLGSKRTFPGWNSRSSAVCFQGQLWELMEALSTGSVLGHPSIFPAKPGSPALPEVLKANNKI